MASVNKVILVGRIGRDPEVRHTQSGQAGAVVGASARTWESGFRVMPGAKWELWEIKTRGWKDEIHNIKD